MGKKSSKETSQKRKNETILIYLQQYEEAIVQSSDEALFDPQIKNITPIIADLIQQNSRGTIFDIGCGNGILLKRLNNLDSFQGNLDWIYLAIDFEDKIENVLQLAINLRIQRRVEVLSLTDFHNNWPDLRKNPKPYLLFIRNVFHEIDIDDTATLIYHILNNIDQNDILLIQDLEVFPAGEHGKACWTHKNFSKLLKHCGLQITVVDEPTRSGNRWFTIIARKKGLDRPERDVVRHLICSEREKQLEYWMGLGCLVPDDDNSRGLIAKLDFGLQCSALQQQLFKANPKIFSAPTPEQQTLTIHNLFVKQLKSYNIAILDNPKIFMTS